MTVTHIAYPDRFFVVPPSKFCERRPTLKCVTISFQFSPVHHSQSPYNCNGKVVANLWATKHNAKKEWARWGYGCIVPRIRKLGHTTEVSCQLHDPVGLPSEKAPRYPFDRGLGGPPRRREKFMRLPGIEPLSSRQ
jgi:hypothetical protein